MLFANRLIAASVHFPRSAVRKYDFSWLRSGADNRRNRFFSSSFLPSFLPSFQCSNLPLTHRRRLSPILERTRQLSPPLLPLSSPPPAPSSSRRSRRPARIGRTRGAYSLALLLCRWLASEIGNQIGLSFRSFLLIPLGQQQLHL